MAVRAVGGGRFKGNEQMREREEEGTFPHENVYVTRTSILGSHLANVLPRVVLPWFLPTAAFLIVLTSSSRTHT